MCKINIRPTIFWSWRTWSLDLVSFTVDFLKQFQAFVDNSAAHFVHLACSSAFFCTQPAASVAHRVTDEGLLHHPILVFKTLYRLFISFVLVHTTTAIRNDNNWLSLHTDISTYTQSYSMVWRRETSFRLCLRVCLAVINSNIYKIEVFVSSAPPRHLGAASVAYL